MIDYTWRGPFTNREVNALHGEAFDHPPGEHDWRARLERYSLGWVCARDGALLVGFVNVPWDGDVHAFVMDTMVTAAARRHGVGTKLVAVATEHARAAGCEWLHVDFEDHLTAFYLDGCGFRPTRAGLIRLA